MRATISRAEVMAFARTLGSDPTETESVLLEGDKVTVVTYKLNEQGGRFVDEATGDAATETTVIPIVGDGRRDTVPMRHPDLPGRVIDVRPRGVGQRAMAGWQVIDPPPKKDPPPARGKKPEAPAESGASSSPPPRGRRKSSKEGE